MSDVKRLSLVKCSLRSILCLYLISYMQCVFSDADLEENNIILDCWDSASSRYGFDRRLLMAFAEQESAFNPKAINARSHHDEDIGLMQINTFWIPHLKKFGITRDDLFNPCISVHVGAWVLAQSVNEFDDYRQGIGAYNVGTSKSDWAWEARAEYANDIFRRYARLLERL